MLVIAFVFAIVLIVNRLDKLKESFGELPDPSDYTFIKPKTVLSESDNETVLQNTSDLFLCEQRCAQSHSCSSYIHDGAQKTCTLQNGTKGVLPNHNGTYTTVTGIKQRVQVTPTDKYLRLHDTEIQSGDILSKNMNVHGIRECQKKCAETSECTVFDYDFNDNICTIASAARLASNARKDAYVRL